MRGAGAKSFAGSPSIEHQRVVNAFPPRGSGQRLHRDQQDRPGGDIRVSDADGPISWGRSEAIDALKASSTPCEASPRRSRGGIDIVRLGPGCWADRKDHARPVASRRLAAPGPQACVVRERRSPKASGGESAAGQLARWSVDGGPASVADEITGPRAACGPADEAGGTRTAPSNTNRPRGRGKEQRRRPANDVPLRRALPGRPASASRDVRASTARHRPRPTYVMSGTLVTRPRGGQRRSARAHDGRQHDVAPASGCGQGRHIGRKTRCRSRSGS